jgi:single-stranded-DNA-specific exonuclease
MSVFYPMYTGDYSREVTDLLEKKLGISILTARALIRRGITDPASANEFLYPSASQLFDPFLLPDMTKAVERIRQAVAKQESICVYGDYDADGICATSILLNCLEAMQAICHAYIPSRHKEGYGLRESSVRTLCQQDVRLIITVDNGINAFYEVALAHELGMDVIITDHHSTDEQIPDCVAVVSASRKDSKYPNPFLCGAGVAFKLAQALMPSMDRRDAMAMAAVATVADVVPLTGENRAITALGLQQVDRNLGFHRLLEVAGWKGQPITSHSLAFMIAPRLNASGRIGNAMRGVELLRSKVSEEARLLAEQLDGDNAARKESENRILAEAQEQLQPEKRAILIKGAGWNPGVIGIVASRLCEQYHRPVILFSENEGVLVGSGRSPDTINLYELLCRFSNLYQRFGGHARAAGVTMSVDRYEAFRDGMETALYEYAEACFLPRYPYEEVIELQDLTVPVINELELLAPFGEGNPEPVYLFQNTRLRSVSRIGTGGVHLCATVMQKSYARRLVAFRMGQYYEEMTSNCVFDVLAKPSVNRFRGREDVELNLSAFARSETVQKLFDAIFENFMYNGTCTDDILAEWYSYMCQYLMPVSSVSYMKEQYGIWRAKLRDEPVLLDSLLERETPDALVTLLVFVELKFVLADGKTRMLSMNPSLVSRDLMESSLYKLMLQGKEACP